MKTEYLQKLTKEELIKMLGKTKEKLEILECADHKNKNVPKLKTNIKKIKHVLYECPLCADAKIAIKIDRYGYEKEILKKRLWTGRMPIP